MRRGVPRGVFGIAVAAAVGLVFGAGPGEPAPVIGRAERGDDEWDERIAVTAELRESTTAHVGASSTVLDPAEVGGAPSTMTDLVVETPGVSQNGQGGHFQVFSVRGVSRHRVMNLVSGMRVISERRAGASISFVDPLLMDSVEVQRGPSTTLHGSGALGGVVQVFPHAYRGWSARTGYDSRGDQNYQVVGFGADGWSLGFARRDGGDARAPDGTRLSSHFTQYSATLRRNWSRGAHDFELLFIPALAQDVGKANSDFPERTTEYPLERHQMLKLAVDSDRGWKLQGWLHAHDLQTVVVEQAQSRSDVSNDSLDYGLRWERAEELSDRTSLRWGFQGVGRHGVDAEETSESLDPGAPPSIETSNSLDGAREIEAGAFTTVRWAWPATQLEAGGRFSWQSQRNAGFNDEDLTALSGFIGAMHRVGSRVEVRSSISSGLRFPNLSERFFSGTTGAGQIFGNPALDAERSLNAEVSARWLARKVMVHAAVFRNEIDDYIERTLLDEQQDLLTYLNLTSGTLQGVELQASVLPDQPWDLTVGGHLLRGRADDGVPLADVPPYRFYTTLRHRRGAWTLRARLAHRGSKRDPGSAEERRSSAEELSATVDRRLSEAWSVAVSGSNLLNDTYYAAADRKAPLVAERSVAIHLVRTGQ